MTDRYEIYGIRADGKEQHRGTYDTKEERDRDMETLEAKKEEFGFIRVEARTLTESEYLKRELDSIEQSHRERIQMMDRAAKKANELRHKAEEESAPHKQKIEEIWDAVRPEITFQERYIDSVNETLQGLEEKERILRAQIAAQNLKTTGKTTEESVVALLNQTGKYGYTSLKILRGKEGVSNTYNRNTIKRKPDIKTADGELIEQYNIDQPSEKNVWLFFHRGRLIAFSWRAKSKHIGDDTTPYTYIGKKEAINVLEIVDFTRSYYRKAGGPGMPEDPDKPVYYYGTPEESREYNAGNATYRETVDFFKQLSGVAALPEMELKEALI